jgi:hypothetical protein
MAFQSVTYPGLGSRVGSLADQGSKRTVPLLLRKQENRPLASLFNFSENGRVFCIENELI